MSDEQNKKDKKLEDLIGFYYLVMIMNPINGYVKCWLDGNEDWRYIPLDDLIRMSQLAGDNRDLQNKLLAALQETSYWLWDVHNGTIKKLTIASDELRASYLLANRKTVDDYKSTPQNNNYDPLKGSTSFWRGDIKTDNQGNIKIKF